MHQATQRLLSRLEGVHARGDGRWSACCAGPLHKRGDRSRGLGIKETDDGRVLINCPAGCTAAEIVAAVGLTLADLFPARITRTGVQPVPQPPFPTAMLDRLYKDVIVLVLAADALRYGKALDDADFETVQRAFSNVDEVLTTQKLWPRERRA